MHPYVFVPIPHIPFSRSFEESQEHVGLDSKSAIKQIRSSVFLNVKAAAKRFQLSLNTLILRRVEVPVRDVTTLLDLERVLDDADVNQDGFVDRDELRIALRKIHLKNKDDTIDKIFEAYDMNTDGVLDAKEMRFALLGHFVFFPL